MAGLAPSEEGEGVPCRGEQQGIGSYQSPERLNLVGELNYPEETLRVPNTQDSKEQEGGV